MIYNKPIPEKTRPIGKVDQEVKLSQTKQPIHSGDSTLASL